MEHYRGEYADGMIEAVGDSSRNGDWALVQLGVDRGKIVRADAPGLDRPLAGLTLLEAAAVTGETLAVDALANALGPLFVAAPAPGRVAVAMSGGVDSAVALLRSVPNAIGVTLRLWLDPQGPDTERACCRPKRSQARATCHELGRCHARPARAVPRAVVEPFVRSYACGETPNPCGCYGSSASRSCSRSRAAQGERLVTGHYARVARTVMAARRSCHGRPADQSHARAARSAPARPHSLPLGGQGKEETRAEAERPARTRGGPKARRRASRRGDYRAFLARQGLNGGGGAIVNERGLELGRHDGFWRYTPGQRRGLGVAAPEPLYALRTDARTNTVVVGSREALARTSVSARGRLYVPSGRVDAKLRYRSPAVPALVEETVRGFRLRLEQPAYAVAPGQLVALYEADAVVGSGVVVSAGR